MRLSLLKSRFYWFIDAKNIGWCVYLWFVPFLTWFLELLTLKTKFLPSLSNEYKDLSPVYYIRTQKATMIWEWFQFIVMSRNVLRFHSEKLRNRYDSDISSNEITLHSLNTLKYNSLLHARLLYIHPFQVSLPREDTAHLTKLRWEHHPALLSYQKRLKMPR